MKIIVVFFIVSLSFLACTVRIDDYVQKDKQVFLSIEGGISDQIEQQTIRIFTTSPRIDNSAYLSPVTAAKVSVINEKGDKIIFLEVDNGIYRTATAIAGKTGSTYQLHIEANGKIYESTAETMVACPDITSLGYEANIKGTLPVTNNFRDGFDIYLNFKDPVEKGNYYRWTWRHYDQVSVCTIKNQLIYHCDSPCFDMAYSSDVNILADDYVNGQEVNRLFITRAALLINEYYSYVNRYYLLVEQRALNKHTYDLFRELKNTENNGSLFDVPALTKFNLNITCITDPSEKILGVFEVYSVKRKGINIRLDTKIDGESGNYVTFPYGIMECRPIPCSGPCVEGYFRTKTVPEGW